MQGARASSHNDDPRDGALIVAVGRQTQDTATLVAEQPARDAEGRINAAAYPARHALKRVERAARQLADAEATRDAAIVRAIRFGLSTRDVAQSAGISHGTIRAIVVRAAVPPETP
jgi:DNA-binding NarL/FixJ family response regulator